LSVRYRTLAEALAYQQRAHGRAMDLGLERVREVAIRLGLLEKRCPVAIVAGTNGKGSTATLLAALLKARGARVGLFTSPHLLRYNERVQIDGVEADDAALLRSFERIESARGAVTLTFFEYNTLAALDVFRDADVGAMVLEVGLGGRLDATNIIDADVALLCSVGFDHRDWLGDTLEQIGTEKAGIFRPEQPVVLGSADMPQSVWEIAEALRCRTLTAGREFRARIAGDGYAGESWDYEAGPWSLSGLPAPALPGAIQYGNAASALSALNVLAAPSPITHAQVAQALRAVRFPGHFQIVPGEVEWILDVAHNEPAARVLARALSARRVEGRTIAIAGMLSDKDAAAVGAALDAVIDHWLLASITDEPRGLSAAALQQRLPALRGPLELTENVAAACVRARALARPRDRVIVLGSFHVVGPALGWLGLY
jgi:dihydrofolate synthase/folylpolyglutamate synthase